MLDCSPTNRERELGLADGAVVFGDEGLIVNETPSEEDLENCKQFGENFAK